MPGHNRRMERSIRRRNSGDPLSTVVRGRPSTAVQHRVATAGEAAPVGAGHGVSTGSLVTGSVLVPTPRTAVSARSFVQRRVPPAWILTMIVDALALGIPIIWNMAYVRGLAVLGALAIVLLAAGGMYRPRLHLSALDDLPRLLGRLLIAVAMVASPIALRHERPAVDGFLRVSVVIVALVISGRFLTTSAIRIVRSRKWVSGQAVLVGAGPVGIELARLLEHYPQYGQRVVGFVDAVHPAKELSGSMPRLGGLAELRQVVERHQVNTLIIADPSVADTQLTEIVRGAISRVPDVLVVPRLHQFQTQTGLPDHIGAIPIMRISPPVLSGWQRSLKRSIDVLVSVLAMVILAPIFGLCVALVRLDGGPGVLFRQQRVGRDGRLFEILKFRSMRPVDNLESQTNWSIAKDNRVSAIGRFLRRTSLDEIPQLWNILRGDMTLVGPRPERPFFVERFSSEYRDYGWRHRVPSGLTGLAQVSGLRGDTPISDRARFDNYYIENWSLWLDFKIVVRTLREVVSAAER
jgi:exopolysaccharide biosynthesis polyprenyl glycosylphosphotransferase